MGLQAPTLAQIPRPADNTDHPDRPLFAMGCAAFAFFCFGVMGAMTKIMTETHHVAEIVFYRNILILLPFFLFLVFYDNGLFRVRHNPRLLLLRCVGGASSMLVTFTGLKHLPITDMTVILFASTLLTPLAAHWLLKDYVGRNRMIAIMIGLCGALLIVRPSGDVTTIGLMWGFAAAFMHTAMYLVLRMLKNVPSLTVTFYFTLTCCIMSGVAMPWVYTPVTMPDLGMFFAIGLFGGMGQFMITLANKNGPPSLVMPFNYTGLIWATGFDIIIWNHVPAIQVYIGASIIIGAKFFILYREYRQKQKAKKAALTREEEQPPTYD